MLGVRTAPYSTRTISCRVRPGAAAGAGRTHRTALSQSPPAIFFAIEAVLMYPTEADVHRACALIGEHFPGAHIAPDTDGKFMVDRQHRHPTIKFMAARMQWACDNPRDLESWNIGQPGPVDIVVHRPDRSD